MSEANKKHFSPVLVLAILILGGVVFALAWSKINSTAVAGKGVDYDRTLHSLGLGSPTTNQLAEHYVDDNDDLVADTPADPAKQRDPETLRFCFLNEQAGELDTARWQPLLDALSEATGKPVEYVAFPTVSAQMRALHDGGLDVTVFNTGNVPRAVNAAGFVPVAAPSIGGQPASYHMLILAKADSGLAKLDDLKSKRLALTRYGSNSGYKAPLVILKDFGLEPERDYDFAFSGSHDKSIAGLADGSLEADAAAVASDLYHAALADPEQELDEAEFTVVYESEPFPRAALGVAHDLKPELAQAITDTLLSFQLAGTSLQPQFADGEGFAPLSYKNSFALVRRMDDAVGFKHAIDREADTTEAQ